MNNSFSNNLPLGDAQGQTAPGAEPSITPDTQGVENINVQNNAELIDDVTNGKFEQSIDNKPINSLSDARSAFEALMAKSNEPVTEQTETIVTEQPIEQTPPLADVNEPSTFTPQAFDESRISSMIQDAIQRQIDQGNLKDLSANDMNSQLDKSPIEESTVDEQNEPIIDIKSDEFYEKFVDDPIAAIDAISNQKANEKVNAVMKELAPLMEQAKIAQQNKAITDTIRKFSNEYADFGDYKDDMVRILNDGNYQKDDINAYKDAYHKSKTNRLSSQIDELKQQLVMSEANRGKSLDDYLGENDSFESLRHNDNLKKAIIEDYIRELKDGSSPRMISGGSDNQPIASPADRVNSFKDASSKFKTMLSH